MRHSIALIAAAVLAAACTDPKFHCADTGGCPLGTTCDTAQKLCVIPGGCSTICKTNEACIAAACVLQSCPVCNANEQCNDATFKCEKVTTGTIKIISPAGGGVIGGATASVVANAGGPNGVLHVDFTLKASGGTQISTVSVSAGDPQGNYTGTLSLSGATTSTGNTLVATVFWNDAAGVTQQTPSGTTTVAIDETPPSISGIATDQAYYSSAANPSGIATVTASIADTGGSAGVDASSVKLTVGSNAPVAGTLQSGSTTVYQFPVSLSTLGVANGSSGAVSFKIAAADQLNNSGSANGTINVDNIAPTFNTPSVPAAWFSGTQTIAPALSVKTADTGGSGVDPATIKVQVDATHGPWPTDTFTGGGATTGTASWTMLTGASFQAADTQGAVPFTFVMKDGAGNAAVPLAQTINIDRKAPTVSSVTAPTWVARTGTVTVTAVVDDTGGSGPASAALSVSGKTDVPGTTSGTGASRTYSFSVPATYQAAGSEKPLAFTVAGTDLVGNTTAAASAGTGLLLIDDIGPRVSSVAVNGGEATVNGIKWFNQLVTTDIDVTALIVDNGSGVDPATVKLVLQSSATTRVDYQGSAGGFPKLDATVPNLWHFAVKRSGGGPIADGSEGLVLFQVVANDKVNHTQQPDTTVPPIFVSTGSLGIDGQKPTVTLTITAPNVNYPPAGTDCDPGTAADPIFCGHDGSHWWRRGLGPNFAELTSMTFTGQELDSNGSGMDPGSGTCAVVGSAITCTPTSGDSLGKPTATYSFKPNFSDATLTGVVDTKTGGQVAAINIAATDAVGNPANVVMATGIQISRLRWVNSLNAAATGSPGVSSLQGAPVVTSSPVQQVIVGGLSSINPVVALKPSGGVLWTSGGAAGISPLKGNMAYDSTASMLYAMGGTTFAGLHTTGATVDRFCTAALTSVVGSPVIYTAGTTGVVLVAESGSTPPRIDAFSPGCALNDFAKLGTGQTTASIGPPTVNGSTIYWAYDNSATTVGDAGVVSAAFASGSFNGVTTHKLNSTTPAQNGVPPLVTTYSFIALADALFFGNSGYRSYYGFSFSYGWNWTTTAFGVSTALVGPAVVAKGLALGISGGNSGQIYAYYKVSGTSTTAGTLKWSYPGSDLGAISSPVTASDGMIYFSDAQNNEFQAIKPAATATTPVMSWNFKGPVGLALNGVSTEATIDAQGIVYFGQGTGNVYALMTDVGAPAAAVGADWPRTGFDNCNSSNTAFSCQ